MWFPRMGRRQRRRIQRRCAKERLPHTLIPQVLLELYDVFSDDDPQRGKVLRRTLAACRLVCHRWSKTVTSFEDSFAIRAYGKEWLSPSFPYIILQRTPPLLTDEHKSNQEVNPGWLPEGYTAALSKACPKFLPELVPNMIPEILRGNYELYGDRLLVQSTLAVCCLVSREWNRIFTPVLYENILLGRKKSLLTRSLLRRTFQHTKPTHKALVGTMTIELAEDGSTANSLSICFSFSFPNLHKLIIDLKRINPATLHSTFAQNLQSLSRFCAVQTRGDFGSDNDIRTQWQSLPIWINFIRRSRSIPCGFYTGVSLNYIIYSKTHFYIGKQEASANGFIDSSDIKPFKQHLTQTGHNLRGLHLVPYEPTSLPEIDLRRNPHLRLLQFYFSFEKKKIRDSQDDVIRWFNSICESVASKSLVVCLYRLINELEICNKIEDILLALHARIETLSVFISTKSFATRQNVDLDGVRKLFSRLYEAGIVVEKRLDSDEQDAIAFGR